MTDTFQALFRSEIIKVRSYLLRLCLFFIWVLPTVKIISLILSRGGAKTGVPREKQPDYPQAELGLSHM